MNSGVIIVEGNIGAGKSTFAQHLAKALDGEYLPEPADGTNPYLADYYADPAKWAFEMQMFLLTRRYRAQKYAQGKVRHKGGFVVLDRSYYGDVCFANVQRQLGYFAEGVRAGVPDLFLAFPYRSYDGLFLEMKKPKGGRVSGKQKTMLEQLDEVGYKTVVCNGWLEAKAVIEEYLEA